MTSIKSTVLYEDKHVKLTASELTIKMYYFPSTNAKHVALSTITAVFHQAQGFDMITSKPWGVTLTPVWWALDVKRDVGHACNVTVRVEGEKNDKGFTVERRQEFLETITPLISKSAMVREGFPYWERKDSEHEKKLKYIADD